MRAVGVIETLGYAVAIYATDAALKAADVSFVGIETVIGVGGKLGVSVQFSGDVASVKAAVESGAAAAKRMGTVFSAHVIPSAHEEVQNKLLSIFRLNGDSKKTMESIADDAAKDVVDESPQRKRTRDSGKTKKGGNTNE